MTDIKSLTIEELKEFVSSLGEKTYRAAQLYDWMHVRHVTSFDEMSNLPKSFREKLAATATLSVIKPVRELISREDGTRKYLFELEDGNIIESVLMRYAHGLSICISSQVGCRMGCRFCASTIDGLVRNLRPSEMVEQIYRAQDIIGERISHVVIMGSGEPMDNFDSFLRFLELTDISHRNITVSTCGIVPKIYELADAHTQITLAVSLHAPNDEIRRQTMPVANKYSMDEILRACRYFFEKTGRRVTFEYSLIRGVNDSAECAQELAGRIKPLNAHVNLIPVNPVKEREYEQPYKETVAAFRSKLERYGINVTIRREMGRDISGACGQLRRHYKEEQ